jgi:hypothetical protein
MKIRWLARGEIAPAEKTAGAFLLLFIYELRDQSLGRAIPVPELGFYVRVPTVLYEPHPPSQGYWLSLVPVFCHVCSPPCLAW